MTGGREELAEILGRAGLEEAGDRPIGNVLPPRAAWRPVAAYGAEPAAKVRSDLPGLVAELNAQWHRLATELGVVDEDGMFLIDVAGTRTGCTPRSWTRVRLTDGWDLAGVLGDRPGQPEFVTLSTDGDALLGATTEEYEVWFIAVDGVKQRQEEAARAAARETPEEREAAWASLFQGPKPTARLVRAWADGLASNPSAPDDLQLRLMGTGRYPHLLFGRHSTAFTDRAVDHPDWKVRARLAEFQPDLTPAQWTRLILGEQDERQRWLLTMVAADRRAELTGTAYEQLATDPSARIREETARLPGLPVPLLTGLAADPAPGVRSAACPRAWPHLAEPARQRLLTDTASKVRVEALLRFHQDHPMPRPVFDSEPLGERAVKTCRLEPGLAEHLAHHSDPTQRHHLARNPHLGPDLLAVLARDEDDSVRFAVSTRPGLTEEQRARVRINADPGIHYSALDWVTALHDDPEEMRRLAASSHFLVRRSVARAERLPPDVVELLARDEDRVVQLFLAESCDDAPADMLMRVWQWWTGSLSAPDRPHSHPNFPRTNLLGYADDPSPRIRRLALDDPESTPDLVDRLSRDPEQEVRYRAARDPRLSTASAVRLLDDSDSSIRWAAAQHLRLPARTLVRLLRDTDTAQDAARNPALPEAVMRRLLDHPEA
ncbi:PE-PGRS family protein [Streptomyces beijiangensis]|uniref:PE-PGRS family protein n=1 Tax=Streptomyces beijiangensis TaxID=163361 RepID=A0A939F8F8_9ACTN|nr:PE-PGRS family protein [Streptomyces beijiangensis]MBO0514536.1 PE-PGRS family protein [Streptomyces beijiangensis]